MDIRLPSRNDDKRFMGATIIELEFEKGPHIIIGGENIQLQMKKEKPKSSVKSSGNSAKTA